MIFLFVIPMTVGAFGNYLVPLMIGARDMAFPRLNALSFWLFLGSGCLIYAGLFLGDGPNAGWFDYVPLGSQAIRPRPQHRLLRPGPDLQRCLLDRLGDQLHRHDLQAASTGNVAEPDAALLLRPARSLARTRLCATGADDRSRSSSSWSAASASTSST